MRREPEEVTTEKERVWSAPRPYLEARLEGVSYNALNEAKEMESRWLGKGEKEKRTANGLHLGYNRPQPRR